MYNMDDNKLRRLRRKHFWLDHITTQRYGQQLDFIIWPIGSQIIKLRVLICLRPRERVADARLSIHVSWATAHAIELEVW